VNLYRDFAAVEPEVVEPELAAALDNLGLILSNLVRHEEAVQAAREGADIRRRLAAEAPRSSDQT
jgi:hypothetical protein